MQNIITFYLFQCGGKTQHFWDWCKWLMHICGRICLEKIIFFHTQNTELNLSTTKATLNSLITVTDLQEACVLSNFQPVMRLDPDVY